MEVLVAAAAAAAATAAAAAAAPGVVDWRTSRSWPDVNIHLIDATIADIARVDVLPAIRCRMCARTGNKVHALVQLLLTAFHQTCSPHHTHLRKPSRSVYRPLFFLPRTVRMSTFPIFLA